MTALASHILLLLPSAGLVLATLARYTTVDAAAARRLAS